MCPLSFDIFTVAYSVLKEIFILKLIKFKYIELFTENYTENFKHKMCFLLVLIF